MDKYTVKWHQLAWDDLKSIYNYYLKKSVQGAENVKMDILTKVDKLKDEPEVNYPYDTFLGSPFRYIKSRRYKIIHKKDKEQKEIRVLGIFDTKQTPKKIQKITGRE